MACCNSLEFILTFFFSLVIDQGEGEDYGTASTVAAAKPGPQYIILPAATGTSLHEDWVIIDFLHTMRIVYVYH